jgi:hypothetical protein
LTWTDWRGVTVAQRGIADFGFRIADCRLRIADCGLQIADLMFNYWFVAYQVILNT